MNFRIYDKQDKRYITSHVFYLSNSGSLYSTINIGREQHSLIPIQQDPDRYIVEYGSGKKDKTGKEIFEGDKVELGYYCGKIAIEDACFWIIAHSQMDIPLWKADSIGIEIIGTIHDKEE